MFGFKRRRIERLERDAAAWEEAEASHPGLYTAQAKEAKERLNEARNQKPQDDPNVLLRPSRG